MANFVFLTLLCHIIIFLPSFGASISSCNGTCQYPMDCGNPLNCINGICQDDPKFGTHICTTGSNPTCNPIGNTTCPDGVTWPLYDCSPSVVTGKLMRAKLRYRDFSEAGSGYQSECDGNFYPVTELVVALSTGWYHGGSRCGKMIRVIGAKWVSVVAKVVDVCDSFSWCDEMHGGQPPCGNNVVEGSAAVWTALGLNKDHLGEVKVHWTLA